MKFEQILSENKKYIRASDIRTKLIKRKQKLSTFGKVI